MLRFYLAFCLLFCALHLDARVRVGLVLSGGGARGAAHIGVLQFLEEEQIPVDCVAGTSMGALIASAWLSGMSPKTMAHELSQVDWSDMFHDAPDFTEVSPHRRSFEYDYMAGAEIGIGQDGLKFPQGVAYGQKIKLFFNHLLKVTHGERTIESLPLPLSIMATDIGTGERVEIKTGNITQAMRASMSVPGLLAPVAINGKKFVDGGLTDNLPIEIVRRRCAPDVVIAVNTGTPIANSAQVESVFDVAGQVINILTEQNVQESLKNLKKGDIYLIPELENFSAMDFAKIPEIVPLGFEIAKQNRPAFLKLKSDLKTWASWQAKLKNNTEELKITEVEVATLQHVNPAAVRRFFSDKEDLNEKTIARDVQRIYADGFFERVDYTVLKQQDRNILRLLPTEKSWGPDYLRFAAHLNSNSAEGSFFNMRAAYHKTWLNALGGEFLVEASLGEEWHLKGLWYQPLRKSQDYFLRFSTKMMREKLPIFWENKKTGELSHNEQNVAFALGRNFGTFGEVSLGAAHRSGFYSQKMGASIHLPRAHYHLSSAFLTLDFEQFDRLYFPRQGWSFKAKLAQNHPKYTRAEGVLKTALPVTKKDIWNLKIKYAAAASGKLPYFDTDHLGGFQNISALAPHALWSDDLLYLGNSWEHVLGSMPLGKGDLRFGVLLEGARAPLAFSKNRRKYVDSSALYLGGETFLGPAFLGVGYSAELSVYNALLFIGMP